ncbi:MAG: ATP-binding cassette domain-containing protein, partial [Steroidobacteraceae bacterium]
MSRTPASETERSGNEITSAAPFPTEKNRRAPSIAIEAPPRSSAPGDAVAIKARAESLSFYYGSVQALKALDIEIRERQVTALIGPSGCGKTTFLRCFNRMHDLTPDTRYDGRILLLPDEIDLVAKSVD